MLRPQAASGGLKDRIRGYRNRLIANPRVQRFVKSFALTRPIAQQKARQLFDLVAGFVYSQILYSCVRLKVLEHLADASLSVQELAGRIDLSEAATQRLADAAVALDLMEWRGDGRLGLGELGAALNANPGIKAMVEHHAMLYADLADPIELLRAGGQGSNLNAYWSYATATHPSEVDHDAAARYSDLMSASQSFISGEVLDAYDLRHHKRLLDVGGGDGTFCLAAADRAPDLKIGLFDLPAVAERATARFAEAGLGARARAHRGDFYRDPLPAGADVVSLVRVMYDHDDGNAMRILQAARAAIAPGGRLLIAEPMAKARGAEAVGDAYFGFYLLAMGSGRARSADEFSRMLHQAGFSNPRTLRTDMPLQTGLIIADAGA